MNATRWTLPHHTLDLAQRPRVMGIVNVTPDSFSDGGRFFDHQSALAHCVKLIEAGADILDIGGESTRPGASHINADEEIRRTEPIIRALRARYDIPISIDTTKADVADAALRAGADIINDISAMQFDEQMPATAAKHNAAVVLMHVPGDRSTMHNAYTYEDIAHEIKNYLNLHVQRAIDAGIDPKRIAIDPGFGFGKDVQQNLRLLRALPQIIALDYPVLVGVSRKRTIRAFVNEDLESLDHGSSVLHAYATQHGAHILRTHNVRATRAAIAMQQALMQI